MLLSVAATLIVVVIVYNLFDRSERRVATMGAGVDDEASLNLLDADFAREQTATFEADLALSEVVTYQAWLHRPWREKAADRIASLIGSQL